MAGEVRCFEVFSLAEPQLAGLKRDFESPTELMLGDHESRVQITGPQSPISNIFNFVVDLI